MPEQIDTLALRIRRLEDRDAIRELKARYLNGCDLKDPDSVRDCFAEGEVLIDYGYLGVFRDRDAFVKVFHDLGCHPHVLDMHHGANPHIELTGDDTATGRWDLHYQNIDMNTRVLTQLVAFYDDGYLRTPSGWKIASTKVRYLSTFVVELDTGRIRRIAHSPDAD